MSGSAKEVDPKWAAQVTDDLKQAVLDRAVEGRITCPVLRKVAEEAGVPNRVAGAAADLAGVRVHNCDLGCF